MKCIYCVLLVLCPYLSRTQGLKVGDQIPKTAIAGLYPTRLKVPTALPSAKLTVLDFMGTYCGACIKILPEMEAIQKEFSGKLDVFLVSEEVPAKLKSWSAARNMGIPFLKNAAKLKESFPHEYISHLVWIDAGGRIIAMTGKEYFTRKNIALALSGATLAWPVKDDRKPGFGTASLIEEGAKPLLMKRYAEKQYQAGFGYQNAIPTQFLFSVDSADGISRMRLVNKPILYWYEVGLQKKGWPKSQVVVYDSMVDAYDFDPQRFYKAAWDPVFCFSYEATGDAAMSKEDHVQRLLDFTNEFFGTHAEMKDSLVDVWLLVSTGGTESFSLRRDKKEVAISSVIGRLNDRFGERPVVDGRDKRSTVYVHAPATLPTEIRPLNAWLESYHLKLQEKKLMLPVMVISRQRCATIFSNTKTYIK